MTGSVGIGAIAAERATRLQSRLNHGSEAEGQFMARLDGLQDLSLASAARDAYEFAKTIEYDHPGLSASSYLAHPVRVAILALDLVKPLEQESVVLGLLHNAFEVSSIGRREIVERFGAPIADAMEILTVDRAQTSHDYRVAYYARISAAPRWVGAIKVIDKLDNMFLLGLNPSEEVRSNYLLDIEEFVMPLVVATIPAIEQYFRDLIDDCRATGYFEPTIVGA
jgi:(p)ppGpp synthase/HD superfamily hydrolase